MRKAITWLVAGYLAVGLIGGLAFGMRELNHRVISGILMGAGGGAGAVLLLQWLKALGVLSALHLGSSMASNAAERRPERPEAMSG